MHLPLRFPTHFLRERHRSMRLQLPRTALRMLMLGMLCACPLGAGAQSTADAGPGPASLQRRATLGNITSHLVDTATDFSCQKQNKVLVSRERIEEKHPLQTVYKCATVFLDGKEVQVTGERVGGEYDEQFGEFQSGLNRVMTFARRIGDVFNPHKMRSGESRLVTDQGAVLNVRPDPQWREVSTAWLPMDCPANMAMTARRALRFYRCAEIWSGNPPSPSPSGTITLRATTQVPCSLTAPNGPVGEVWQYNFLSDESPCPNDTAQSVELQVMPSATRILLDESPTCAKDEDLWIELRTTAKSVTSEEALNLDEFFTYSPGAIVQPGLQLVNFYRDGTEPAVNRISCVRITTSSAPPSS